MPRKTFPFGSKNIHVFNDMDRIEPRSENDFNVFFCTPVGSVIVGLYVETYDKPYTYDVIYQISFDNVIPIVNFEEWSDAIVRAKEFIEHWELKES